MSDPVVGAPFLSALLLVAFLSDGKLTYGGSVYSSSISAEDVRQQCETARTELGAQIKREMGSALSGAWSMCYALPDRPEGFPWPPRPEEHSASLLPSGNGTDGMPRGSAN